MAVSRSLRAAAALLALALLGGCAGPHGQRTVAGMPAPASRPLNHPPLDLPALPAAGSGRGGYYKDDGPGDTPPARLLDTPDAEVRAEPLSRYANRPYVVFGKRYTPIVDEQPFFQRGVSSWYGKKFHGHKTSSGEIYDMYKMSAAHPTLPIPSYARITHKGSGKQVVVRINDRGPFHAGRIVDVSYTAALKLGLLGSGSHEVELERLLPKDALERLATIRRNAPEAPLASEASAPEPVAEAAPTAGFYVQLGAFSRADKAAAIRERVAGLPGLGEAIAVFRAGALHRLLAGPFDSRALAQEAARAVPAALGLKPIVIKR